MSGIQEQCDQGWSKSDYNGDRSALGSILNHFDPTRRVLNGTTFNDSTG